MKIAIIFLLCAYIFIAETSRKYFQMLYSSEGTAFAFWLMRTFIEKYYYFAKYYWNKYNFTNLLHRILISDALSQRPKKNSPKTFFSFLFSLNRIYSDFFSVGNNNRS